MSTPNPFSLDLSGHDYQRVLVTGVGGPSGKAATVALKERGFSVLGVDMQVVDSDADLFIKVPPASDDDYRQVLHNLISDHRVGWLFPTVADELVIVAEMAGELRAQGVSVFISEPAAVKICQDKWTTSQVLHDSGIAVPASAVGSADSPTVQRLAYPRVSRPRVGRGGRGVVVHDGPGTEPAVSDPVWQEFMSGTEYDVLCVRHPDSPHSIVMNQVFEKTHLKQGRVGNALELRAVNEPDIKALAEAAACALSLTGPLDMDIRRDHNGIPRLLEINARIGAHALKAPELFDILIDMVQKGHRG